jgi:D-beta-D-heptose 7-phosphate kinase / D-beta-D-heptose 1-phosphate adenosyltransferase
MKPRVVVVGDVLLDKEIRGRAERLSPEAPVPVVEAPISSFRAGGAGLAASLAARDGCHVTLISAFADDVAGHGLRELLGSEGIETINVGMRGSTPEKIRIGTNDHFLLRLDQGDGVARHDSTGPDVAAVLAAASVVLVSDYGRGVAASPWIRRGIESALATIPVVWDPHPKGPDPVPGVRLATPNASEVRHKMGSAEHGLPALARLSELLRSQWGSAALCTTLGQRGAVMVDGSATPFVVPPPSVVAADSCGAGDRFAVSAARALGSGALVSEAVTLAVTEATSFIASGSGGMVGDRSRSRSLPSHGDVFETAAAIRAAGGTVVATGGCFDLLHAGHVSLVKAAARLGDLLVVCINSDASVKRLKGPQRPLVGEEDRAEVLRSIEGVDGVVVFEEDTPATVLERLRPHLFVKGADYGGAELPEAEVLARWEGRAVVLPYLDGRSTTAIVEEVIRRGQD